MHPHGIFYSNEMDGAYKGKFTDPGGFVQHNRTFTYVWEAQRGDRRDLALPRPRADGPAAGLQGPVRAAGDPRAGRSTRPKREFFLGFHTFDPPITGLKGNYYCINGRAYAGNTPDLEAKVGQRVAFHVYGVDNFFHTFHLHGHRWTDPDGTIIDNKTFGPADSFRVEFVEDNPGRWFYHCHVFQHFHMGMNGWYIVSLAARAPVLLRPRVASSSRCPAAGARPTTRGSRSPTTLVEPSRSTSTSVRRSPGTGSGPTSRTR